MSTSRKLAGVLTWALLLLATLIAACGRVEQQSSETTADGQFVRIPLISE